MLDFSQSTSTIIFGVGLTTITQLINEYGYLAVFLLMLGESTVVPIPSEVVLPFAGALVALGYMNPIFGFIAGLSGAIVGAVIMFYTGKALTKDVILRYIKNFGLVNIKTYRAGVTWFRKYGNYVAFFSKMVPLIRNLASAICGAYNMDMKKYMAYTTAGIALWTAILMYAGYYFYTNFNAVVALFESIGVYLLVAAVVIILVVIFEKRIARLLNGYNHRKHRRS